MDLISQVLPELEIIKSRLPLIFPEEGIENRNYVVREIAAKTIFVMFYVGAIEGNNVWMRPSQVTMMSDNQSVKRTDSERILWTKKTLSQGYKETEKTWYAANTREPIRDETLRLGLIPLGAVIEKPGIPTTSSLPRYALNKEFSELFDLGITQAELEGRILKWQEQFLEQGSLARIKLLKRSGSEVGDNVIVSLPNGEARKMSGGPSSLLTKQVIEVFAKRFLIKPALIFLSESGNKVITQDDDLAASIGLKIEVDKNLPDIILADLGTSSPLIIFVEVVFSDGPISTTRRKSLLHIATKAKFKEENVLFVSAFSDRGSATYRRLSSDLAWDSFVWFSSEPENLVILKNESSLKGKTIGDFI